VYKYRVTYLHILLLFLPTVCLSQASDSFGKTDFSNDTSADKSITVLPEVLVSGRQDSLIGITNSATNGVIGTDEISNRPLLRVGEIIETIPGLIVTQHAGGGKANQYFTRGFNLDHGTDFAIDLENMPLNLQTHAHGQGYADINSIIPELISQIDFQKGPYYTNNGDFATVGAAHLEYASYLPINTMTLDLGSYDYKRLLYTNSNSTLSGHLIEGLEYYHENGPWVNPDDYKRYNAVVKYTQGDSQIGFNIIAMLYHGTWNSTDQIAESAVISGEIPFYGTQSPTDGGVSQKFSLQAQWHKLSDNTETHISLYAFHYNLDLFSNFTYYLDSPQGDQFEQQDNRTVFGANMSKNILSTVFGLKTENSFTNQSQLSLINVGLYQTLNRKRSAKIDYFGENIPAATKVDSIDESSSAFIYNNKIWWTKKLRSELGFRDDAYLAHVSDNNALNSGAKLANLFSPKANLIYTLSPSTELYLQSGYGFHSNDVRAVTAKINPDDSSVNTKVPLLIHALGSEIGLRTTAIAGLHSTVSIWYLTNNSELHFDSIDQDSGQTSITTQSTHRYGFELSNYYTPIKNLIFDLDYAESWAYFDTPTTATEDITPGGTLVPEAIHQSIATGVEYKTTSNLEVSLRLRYFGPRPLTSDGSISSKSTSIINFGSKYKLSNHCETTFEILNLLNRKDHDIDYYYQSKVSRNSSELNQIHFHPIEPLELRLGLTITL